MYAGLGSGRHDFADLNASVGHLQTWQSNISAATGNMQVTQTAMTQIQQIASDLLGQLNGLQGADGSEIDTIASTAQSDLAEVANLLNSTNGTTYVFAGTDSSNPPVPDPDAITSSGFYTQIAAAVADLSTAGATATASATLSIAVVGCCRHHAVFCHHRQCSGDPDAERRDPADRAAGKRERLCNLHRQLHHRFLHAGPDASTGDGRIADQLAAERSRGWRRWCRTHAPVCRARFRRWRRTLVCWAIPSPC